MKKRHKSEITWPDVLGYSMVCLHFAKSTLFMHFLYFLNSQAGTFTTVTPEAIKAQDGDMGINQPVIYSIITGTVSHTLLPSTVCFPWSHRLLTLACKNSHGSKFEFSVGSGYGYVPLLAQWIVKLWLKIDFWLSEGIKNSCVSAVEYILARFVVHLNAKLRYL